MRVFLAGTLCHAPLRRVVLGRDLALRPARIADAVIDWDGGPRPRLVAAPGQVAEGGLAEALTEDDLARLDHHAAGAPRVPCTVLTGADETLAALVHRPDPAPATGGAAWSLDLWADRWGRVAAATAEDVMALRGSSAPGDLFGRYGQMLVRGAARAEAAGAEAPAARRRPAGPGDVAVAARRQPYGRYFAVEEYDLSFRRFDGTMSETINRAVFVTGDAATVLPYDPVRDRVLLIEQFRAGPFARGDRNPWLLEPIAGRIDPGESAEAAARREAREEAGLTLGALHLVGRYYPTPAAKSEFLHSFVGLADLPDGIAGIAGVAEEAEDIRSHVLPFDAFREIARTPEAACGPLLLTALWLEAERPRLRAGAGA